MVDHTLFRPNAIDPETAAFNAELQEVLAEAPAIIETRRGRRARKAGHRRDRSFFRKWRKNELSPDHTVR